MKVRDVMTTTIITVSPAATYEETARILRENGVSGVPVVGENGTIFGIISEKDLFRALFPRYEEYTLEPHPAYLNQEAQEKEIEALRRQPVANFMNPKVITIEANAPILHAGGLMLARGLHRLPVVENGTMVGIVSREDIYGVILKKNLS